MKNSNGKKFIFLYLIGLLLMISCKNNTKNFASSENHVYTSQTLIDKNGIGIFKINKSLKDLNLPEFDKITDTSYSDEDGMLYGKQYYFDKVNSVLVWIGDGDTIYEISTGIDNYSTKEGIKVGVSFSEIFKMLNKNYSVITDCNEIALLDKKNHLRIWFTNSNSDLFTIDEINDLFKYKLSISKDKLDKMIVRKLDLILIEDR